MEVLGQISIIQLLNGDRPIVQCIGHLSTKQKNMSRRIIREPIEEHITHRKHRKELHKKLTN